MTQGVSGPPVRHAALKAIIRRIAERPSELHAIVAESPEAVIAFDERRHILHANGGAEALFGYSRGALDGGLTDLLLPERLRQPQAPPMTPIVDITQVDLPGIRKDGTELSVEWAFGSLSTSSGHVFVMTVNDREATERGIEALRASEERFRLLVDGVHGYAIFTLDPAGKVSSWNRGAERSKGWPLDEVIGQPYSIFFTPEDRAAGVPERLLAAAIREGGQEVTGWRVRKDGTRFRANASLTALRSPSGELRGFAKITRDLTEKLMAEELE
jgi:PAS domain S-box-containing protein